MRCRESLWNEIQVNGQGARKETRGKSEKGASAGCQTPLHVRRALCWRPDGGQCTYPQYRQTDERTTGQFPMSSSRSVIATQKRERDEKEEEEALKSRKGKVSYLSTLLQSN